MVYILYSTSHPKRAHYSYRSRFYDYAYISRSTLLYFSGSCTVRKRRDKLVHGVTLHFLQLSSYFMLFMPSHQWSCNSGSLQLLLLFGGRWQKRLLRQYFNSIICGLSAVVAILQFFSDDLNVSNVFLSSPFCWNYSIWPTYICPVPFVIEKCPCNFIFELVVTKYLFFLKALTIHKVSVCDISIN